MVFKTINEKEFHLIRVHAGISSGKDYTAEFNLYYMVYSLLMLDGQFVLKNRNPKELRDLFAILPNQVCKAIFSELEKIRDEAFEAVRFLEGYAYTMTSRYKWRTLSNGLPNQEAFTGVPGSDILGLNVHQENWIHINRTLDDEDDYNRQFSMALLVASATNPKGSKTIRARHDSVMKDAEDRRERLATTGGVEEAKREWKPDGWAAPVDTREELLAELDRQMHGVKDKHDIFMENYLKRMRDGAESKARQAREKMEEARKAYGDKLPDFDGSQRALTPEETKQLYQRKRGTITRMKSEEDIGPEHTEKILSKIGGRILTSRN